MVCIFCRSNSHSKSSCSDRRVIQVQYSHILRINQCIESACNLRIERVVFENHIKDILNSITVIELKMVIEYYKKLVPIIPINKSTKKNMVPIIILYIKAYNYTRLRSDLTHWDNIEPVPNIPVRRNPRRAIR